MKYIEGDQANLNFLQLIVKSQNIDGMITDKIRLKAKKRYEEENKKLFENSVGMKCGVEISFSEIQEEEVKVDTVGGVWHFSYSLKWFVDNVDFPILMIYNFIHVFGLVDSQCRLTYVHKPRHMGQFEKLFGYKGKKEYTTGFVFEHIQMMSLLQLKAYRDLLESKKIYLEDILQWFFEDYIFNEFDVNGFFFHPPSKGASYLEKCRTVISETDSILKQFRYWVEDKEINHELLQISSEHIFFRNIPSLIERKYVYPIGEDYNRVSSYLCSDQSVLSHIDRVKTHYSSCYELLANEDVEVDDFLSFQKPHITWLIDKGFVYINSEGYVKNNFKVVWLIKELYENEVLSYHHLSEQQKTVINSFNNNGLIEFESSLFSKPEQDYFNYLLNKSEFTNGLDLRNRYSHGTQSNDESIHQQNYLTFLKILFVIALKINDEFVLQQTIESK